MVSDVTGTDWYMTSGRSTSVVRWRQLSFAAEALNYSQIIMTVVFLATNEAASNRYYKEFYTC